MNIRICVALLALLSSPALAQEPNQPPPSTQGGLFQGTPEEQAACSPDATRFCKDSFPDTFKVLACLKTNREKLRQACRKVLETHGQ